MSFAERRAHKSDGKPRHSLTPALAVERGIRSVAFPSISTGVYGYPVDQAARVALQAIRDFLKEHPGVISEVRMVLFSQTDFDVYRKALEELSTAS